MMQFLRSPSPTATLPEIPLHDLGRRALFASVGGGILAFLGLVGFLGKYGFWLPAVAIVIGVVLIFASLALLTNADRAVATNPAVAATAKPFALRQRYQMITRLEYGGFLVALVICELFNQMPWLLPIVTIVAGIHYLALGQVLRSVSAWVKGTLLCLLALATLLLLPEFSPAHAAAADQFYLWWVVTGVAGGAILWIDAILCLARGFFGGGPGKVAAR